jgi:hypothetical protein
VFVSGIAIAIVCVVAGAVLGYAAGERDGDERGILRMWHTLEHDRAAGHAALERLAKAHGAKVELTELAG